jgi:PKD repeat protein
MFPGGSPNTSALQNPANICYDVPGVYDVTLITTSANGSDTLTLHNYITVFATPPFPTITQAGYTLTSSTASFYQWQFNSVDIPGATNQSYTAMQTGLYTVTVSDSNGCVNSANQYILISDIDEVSDADVSVYPNPSSGSFTIELSGALMSGDVSIEGINTLGQKVFSSAKKVSSSFKMEIEVSNVARGIYFIEIKTANAFVRKKILVE